MVKSKVVEDDLLGGLKGDGPAVEFDRLQQITEPLPPGKVPRPKREEGKQLFSDQELKLALAAIAPQPVPPNELVAELLDRIDAGEDMIPSSSLPREQPTQPNDTTGALLDLIESGADVEQAAAPVPPNDETSALLDAME